VLSGNALYGTTINGGANGKGTVFTVNTDGTGFTVLHNFTGGDGSTPFAGLVLSGGTLYGTTFYGGDWNDGTVFSVNTNGTGFTTLHTFTAINSKTNLDGANPYAGLVLSGNTLYGTADGGSSGEGTLFAVNTDGTGFTNPYSFTGGSDGASPQAGLILSGNTLYGTATEGGTWGDGTVFSLSLGSVDSFVAVKGTYNGLFYDETNGVAPQSSGFFTIATTAKGTFSGSVQVGGHRFSLSGQFDRNGKASKTITRPKMASLTVGLQLDFSAGSDQITGSVSDGTWTAHLAGCRVALNSRTNPAPQAGKYTLRIPAGDDSLAQPGGDGFGAVTVDGSGKVKVAGTLGDGTKVTQTTVLSQQGLWPFYASLYSGNGLILGWLTFTNQLASDIDGPVGWIKLAQPTAKLYRFGFTNATAAIGSKYAFTNGIPVLNFSAGQVWLACGNLPGSFTNRIVFGTNKVTNLSSNKLSLTLTTSSGLFKGSVVNPATGKAISINGAVLQKQNFGFGSFLGTNQCGQVYFGRWI
jgi:uncharacterized repeat protein (TIGR03803 family)